MSKIKKTKLQNNSGEQVKNPIFLTRQDLHDLGIRVSGSTLIRWQNAGKFPKVVHLGGTKCVWARDQIMQWCKDRIEEAEHFTYSDF